MRPKKRNLIMLLRWILFSAAAVAAVLWLFTSVSNISVSSGDTGREQLERTIRRAAVTCYATEGRYPPTFSYLEEHYGVQIDTERYMVFYNAFADNLMPDITVLINGD